MPVTMLTRTDRFYSTADDTVLFAIGDIHGQYEKLVRLVKVLAKRVVPNKNNVLVFVGDYIDRGPDSKKVLEYLISIPSQGIFDEVVYLMGNHEQMLSSCLEMSDRFISRDARGYDPSYHTFVTTTWIQNGGLAVLNSYGIKLEVENLENLVNLMPKDHVRLIMSTKDYYVNGDYLFVHAGVHPDSLLKDQDEMSLFWIRSEFLHHKKPYNLLPGDRPNLKVIHGHTIADRKDNIHTHRINLDTGAFSRNVLSGVKLEGNQIQYFSLT